MKISNKRIAYFIQKAMFVLERLILGTHPNNTIFSFNYHNVYHINKFLTSARNDIGQLNNIIVDIGAGRSPYYFVFSDIVQKYFAIDTAESLPKQETRAIQQIVGCAEAIPFENSLADIVLCNQVLEHVKNPEKAVSEMYRLLKPGGYCIGSVPHVSPVHLEPYDFRRYTDLGLEKLLTEAGFIDLKIEGSGGVYSAAALMIGMDWMLSLRQKNRPQGFSTSRALLLSPVVGFMNLTGMILDTTFGNKNRTPANLCWIAMKPLSQDHGD